MSGKLESPLPLPPLEEVERVLVFCDQQVEKNKIMIGALMVVLEGGMQEEIRQQFAFEYRKLVAQLLVTEQQKEETSKSYEVFEKYIRSIVESHPNEEVFEYTLLGESFYENKYVSYHDEHDSFICEKKIFLVKRLRELFGGALPNHVLEELKNIPRKADDIRVSLNYTVIPEGTTFGVECTFDIVYEGEDDIDGEIEIIHTFDSVQDAYQFLLRNTKKEIGFEQILSYERDEFSDTEMDRVLEDSDVLKKIELCDRNLFLAVQAYVDNIGIDESRLAVIDSINRNHERKLRLRTYAKERSIGRLRYIIENAKVSDFYLWLRDDEGDAPASMLSFPACTPDMKTVLREIERITGGTIGESFSGWRRITFSVSGEVLDTGNITLSFVFIGVKNKEYTYTADVDAEQFLAILQLLTETNLPMEDAIWRENDEADYDEDE